MCANILYEEGQYDDALNVIQNETATLDQANTANQVDESFGAKQQPLDQLDPTVLKAKFTNAVNEGCIHYQKRSLQEALAKFTEAKQLLEVINSNQINPELVYNLALTYFDLGEYDRAIECLDKILSKAYESYP